MLLEVNINGHPIGKIGEFTLRRGKLFARPSELRTLGFQVPLSHASEADALIPLSDLPGLSWNLDEQSQVLNITASNGALLPTILLPQEEQAGRRLIESGKGITLNDDVIGTYAGGKVAASGSFDLRAFSPWGVTSSGWLVNAGSASIGTARNTAIRLDSGYSFADVNSLRRYSLGDFITSSLSWTRALHMEGVQIRSDFSMRPDLVTFPLPLISGSAAVPSTVNVLTDGNAAISHSVDAGPFEIPQLPVVSGAGTITMTVTNALGQQVTVTQPFYASSTLLTPGLQTFAGQIGLVRRNWGSVSNDYGKLAAIGSYRRGITRKFTIEVGGEGTEGAAMAGVSSVLQVGNLGAFTFALSPSIASGHFGEQLSAGAQRIGRVFSLGASATIANRNYRDVASMNGSGIARKQLSAFTSCSFKRFGSFGISYVELNQDAAPTLIALAGGLAQRSRVVTANYSVQIKRASFYATEFRNLRNTGNGSNGLQVGVIIPIGKYRSVSAAGGSDGSRQFQVQQSAPQVGDWGYQAYVAGGNSAHEFAQGQYKAPVGLFTAGVDRNDGLTTLRVESLGAISLVDKALFASNEIYDSFAVVDTRPVENIRVYQENRYVGTTGKTGRVLVPDMRAFDLNHISIDPTDVPADVSLSSDKLTLRPQDRSGVVIKFPIHVSHSALLRLVDQAGAFVPQGSVATLRATIVPVGYDGQAYVEDLSPHNELSVEYPDGKRCAVVFDYLPLRGDIPSIGPLQCLEKRP